MKTILAVLFLCLSFTSAQATTWYVRHDGGTRFSADKKDGQCDGQADAAYSGQGVNQHCAFNDVRYLWYDGAYTVAAADGFPRYGWVGKGGDTYIVKGAPWRVGQSGPTVNDGFGMAGNPYASPPPPPSGTASAHTRLLGENWASCSAANKTQLFGGYATGAVLTLAGAANVDVQCIELTDHGSCTRIGQPQTPGCSNSYPLDDAAANGIVTDTGTRDVLLKDLDIHGFTSNGIIGAIGGTVTVSNVRLGFNAGAGWEFDDGNSTQSVNNPIVVADHLLVEGNGCNEEYPIVHKFPAKTCYDQESAGYGDGIGTPGTPLSFTCDYCTFRYNTQDGFDLLHTSGSIVKVTNSASYSNMGQQWKMGAMKQVIFENNLTVHNCRRMSAAMPDSDPGYNKYLSLFCRAGGDGFAFNVTDAGTYTFQNNSYAGYGSTTYDIECSGTCTKPTIIFQNNLHIGYKNPNPADGQFPGVFYTTGLPANPFLKMDHNIFYNMRTLPEGQNGADPHVLNEPVWKGEASLDAIDFHLTAASANAAGRGAPVDIPTDYDGVKRAKPSSIGAFEPTIAVASSRVRSNAKSR